MEPPAATRAAAGAAATPPGREAWWLDLRFSRSAPPGLAARSKARADAYRASLRGFEELMHAADVSGATARPMPLQDAVAQAGRAIAAAHRPHEDWDIHGPGLRIAGETIRDGLRTLVERAPGAGTGFGVVRETTGSRDLTAAVELGALMMSLPELARVPSPPGSGWRRALRFRLHHERFLPADVLQAVVTLEPGQLDPADPAGSITRTMAAYPTAAGWRHPRREGVAGPLLEFGNTGGVFLWWVGIPSEPEARREAIDITAQEYRVAGERWLWPSAGPDPAAPVLLSPLMTWWALLHGLAAIAREAPAAWAGLIDADSSPWATAIGQALDVALEAVPQLVRDALVGTRYG